MSKRQEIEDAQEKAYSKKQKVEAGQNLMSRKLASYWKDQVKIADEQGAGFNRRGNAITKRYRDSRSRQENDQNRRMNVLWTNIQIMKPAVYSKCPQAIVERKFLDQDKVGRLSAQILERGVRNEISLGTTHASISMAVDDFLLVGRGQVWVRYEPEIGRGDSLPSQSVTSDEDPLNDILDENEDGIPEDEDDQVEREDDEEGTDLLTTGDQVVAEKVPLDYIDWHDFYQFPARARTWMEVQAVGKLVWMSRTECIEFFGDEIGKKIEPDPGYKTDTSSYQPFSDTAIFQQMNDRDRRVYEVWNKTDRRVYWFSSGYDYLCKCEDDPLKLPNFFPCPKPLVATTTNDTIEPVPDYSEYEDQAIQIDQLTQRISLLSQACKVAGTYNAANPNLKRLLDEGYENKLVPVDSWAAHAESGGVAGDMSFMPLKEIIMVLQTLTEVRQTVKQDLDEVTGLSDILRGTTDSRETLGGLRLKNNNAGTRLTAKQTAVAEFAREAIELQAVVMAKHFSDESLIETSGIMFEDELNPETVLDELMDDPDVQQKIASAIQQEMQRAQQAMQAQMAAQQQQQQLQQQMGQPGNNVVPMQPGQPPQQTQPQPQGGMNPQVMQQKMQQYQQMLQEDAINQLKQMVPEIITKRIQDSIKLLQKDIARRYRIDIETDSTVFMDAMQERQDATEFIQGIMQFFMGVGEIGQAEPEALPLFAKMLQWSVRKFRVGRDLESQIDSFVKKMTAKAKELAKNPPPNPEVQKQQLEMQKTQYEMKSQQQNDERDAQRQEAEDQRTFAQKQAEGKMKMFAEQQKNVREERMAKLNFAIEMVKAKVEMQKLGMEQRTKQIEHRHNLIEMDQKSQLADRQMRADHAKVSMGMQADKQKHALNQKTMKAKAQQSASKK